METNIKIKLQPFGVPSVVRVDHGQAPNQQLAGSEVNVYELRMIDVDTLNKMCDEFRDAVLQKAGHTIPPYGGGES